MLKGECDAWFTVRPLYWGVATMPNVLGPPLAAWFVGALTVVGASCGGVRTQGLSGNGPNGDEAGVLFTAEAGASPAENRCTTDADCGSGGLCDPVTQKCSCGGTLVTASHVPPNLLVVLDRSCSMQKPVAGTPKWTLAVQSLEKLFGTYAARIRFGLALFPERGAPDRCTVATIPVPVGAGNAAALEQLLSASLLATDPNYPSGPCVTPIDAAMTEAAADLALADPMRGDFVLLITDGKQAGCNAANGDAVTLAAISGLASKGVRTFVVGFGAAVSTTSLDAFARAGGVPNAGGPNAFYDAADAASLDGALASIAQSTLSCTLQLSSGPPNDDPNLIFVYFDKMPPLVSRDTTHQDGWDYDPSSRTLTFHGTACERLKSGQVKDAEVVFGCAGSSVAPSPIH
jgi:hypothetical protein